MLKKYIEHTGHVLEYQHVGLDSNLSYGESPVQILETKYKELRSRNGQVSQSLVEEPFTWRVGMGTRRRYAPKFPGVISVTTNFEDEI